MTIARFMSVSAVIVNGMAGPAPVRDRLRHRYERGGVRAVLSSVPRFLRYQVFGSVYPLGARWLLEKRSADPLDRNGLLERAGSSGQLWRFGEPETVTIEPPDAESLPGPLHDACGTYTVPAPFVTAIGPAKLVGRNAIGFTARNEPILETTEGSGTILRDHLADELLRSGFRTTIQAVGAAATPPASDNYDYDLAFPLVKPPSTNYYHWILGYLGKVHALERYRTETGRDPTVLIGADEPAWVTQSLELAGIDIEATEEWPGGLGRVNRLIVPSHPLPYGGDRVGPPTAYRALAERMRTAVNATGDLPSRIYVSRRDAETRRVRNEAALRDVLESFDVEPCVLGDRSVAEQIALFSQAELVVGPHGAGLTNLLFADDPSVVELFPEGEFRTHYFLLARSLGFAYEPLVCERVRTDMIVDPDALATTLGRLLD